MAADRNYHIRPVLDGQTLAAGLRLLIKDLSWNDARKLVHNRHVWVNGNLVVDEARRLKGGDVVKVFAHPRAPVPTERDVRVLYVDNDLIVVDKPAGITTLRHPEEQKWDDRRKQRQPTLDEVVQQLVPDALAAARRAGPAGGAGPSPKAAPSGGLPAGGGGDADEGAGGGGRRHGPQGDADPTFGVIRRPGGRRVDPPAPPPPGQHAPQGRGGKPGHPPSAGRHPAVGGSQADGSRPGWQVGPGPSSPTVRPVHRLDRDTSGLMLFALSWRAEAALVTMFKEHTVRRSYLAVVHGRVTEPMRIESWIARDRGDGHRGSTASGRAETGAQKAVTHVAPERAVGDRYTVVRCQLETGRTHQIRIHLAEAGHMLCGEKTYVRPKPDAPPVTDDSGAPRQALHSAEVEFIHPVSGQTLTFSTPWPKEMAQWLGRLGKA
jgi:23S rRNA-/tRNA-specific pseudouridylate synthase